MGVNHLTDRTSEEIHSLFTGVDRDQLSQRMEKLENEQSYTLLDVEDIPAKVDWRDENKVTKVKNQG